MLCLWWEQTLLTAYGIYVLLRSLVYDQKLSSGKHNCSFSICTWQCLVSMTFSHSAADCVFAFGHLTWSLSDPLPIKQGSPSSFVSLWEGSGEVGVNSLVWNSKEYVQIAVLCLTAIPSKDFLQKGSKAEVWINQEGSGICSTGGVCLDGVDLLGFLLALV